MILEEWNTDDAIAFAREEGREDGLEEGRAEGREDGIEIVLELMDQGLTSEEIKARLAKITSK